MIFALMYSTKGKTNFKSTANKKTSVGKPIMYAIRACS